MPESKTAEDCVLVLAPTGRDAALISGMLSNGGLACIICKDVEGLTAGIEAGAGLGLMAEEALIGTSLELLLGVLSQQPAWSDFPLLFLTTSGTRASETSTHVLRILGAEANVTILERPVRLATLLSSVRSTLRARRRQYQVREYLQERKRYEEEQLQTQKLESLGVLAGGVAHDFNNLLTGILGNSSLALESIPPGWDEVRSALHNVINASEHAASLTKQLLAYAGKGKFVIEPLDLSEMTEAVAHLIQSAVSKNAVLHLDLPGNLPTIEGDATQLQQIIMNLVINAAESISADRKGEVYLTTRAKHVDPYCVEENFHPGEIVAGEYILLEVRDNGNGMSDSTLARIFDPFFTTKFTGRGLGLAAVQGIVRGHKGALKVHTRLNEGTTFQVYFPVSGKPVKLASDQISTAERITGEAITVLVIDDEAMVRSTARAVLKRYGYESVLAADGAEGIAFFKQKPQSISVVLLDLTMPGMGGEEVFRHLKAIRSDLKVILSSGFNEVEVVQRFMGKGLAGFIQKPYTSGALITTVKKVLEEENR